MSNNVGFVLLTGILAYFLLLVISDCPPGKKTDNAQGRCCVFPFTYKGVQYHSCTTADHNKPWCSFDAVYKGQWANCGKRVKMKFKTSTMTIPRRIYKVAFISFNEKQFEKLQNNDRVKC